MQKSYQSRLFQKSEIVFVQNRQFCQLPFLPVKTIILAIDSNGAVGHLLTRSAVFVKMYASFGFLHCGRPKAKEKSKIK